MRTRHSESSNPEPSKNKCGSTPQPGWQALVKHRETQMRDISPMLTATEIFAAHSADGEVRGVGGVTTACHI